jgi:erythromycin esterase
VLVLLCSSCSQGEPAPADVSQGAYGYLERNFQPLQPDGAGLPLLDSSLAGKEVLLTGEVHGIATDQALDTVFLKYFRERSGARYYLGEFGYSFGYFVNRYLDTGDEALLRKALDAARGSLAWTKEYRDRWKRLREYNQTLPADQRIVVLGIDLEWQPNLVFEHLRALLPDTAPPSSIAAPLGALTGGVYAPSAFKALVSGLSRDVAAFRAEYEAYLGDRLFDFDYLLHNMLNLYENEGILDYTANQAVRNQRMYENFLKLNAHHPYGRHFSQLGSMHVLQRETQGIRSVADWMNNSLDSPVRGKVLSVIYYHRDCAIMTRSPYSTSAFHDEDALTVSLGQIASPHLLSLFKLDGEGSPLKTERGLVQSPSGGATVDYFQAIVLIRNAAATSPIEP